MARPSPQTDRLISVVDLLASRPGEGLTLSDIARRLGLSPVTCHPMLASLLGAGWLVRHPTRKTWLNRSGGDAETKRSYEQLLTTARGRGYSVDLAVPEGDQLRTLLNRLDEHILDEDATASPGALRAFLEQVAAEIPSGAEYS